MKTPFLPVLTALALAALPAGAASTVIDNSSPSGYSPSGSWTTQGGFSVFQRYNQDWQYQNAGGAPDTASWSFTGLAAGKYYVAVSTPYNGQPNLCPDALYTLSDNLGSYHLNQAAGPRDFDDHRSGTDQWGAGFARLSTFNGYLPVALTGDSLTVTVSNFAGSGFLTADAARIEPARADALKVFVIGDREASRGYSEQGAWASWGGEYEHNHDYRFSGGGPADVATFAFTGLDNGAYRVSATWTISPNRPDQAEYAIQGGDTIIVSQKVAPADDQFEDVPWKDLFPSVQVTDNTLTVTLRSLDGGVAIADAVRLELIASASPVGILQPPQGGTYLQGETATLSVLAGGAEPLHYRWQKGTTDLGAPDSRTLVLQNLTVADSGDYRVIVSNVFGSETSRAATVTVLGGPVLGIEFHDGLTFDGLVGLHYRVDYQEGGAWQLLQDIPSLPRTPYTVYDPAPVSLPRRSYRAVLVP